MEILIKNRLLPKTLWLLREKGERGKKVVSGPRWPATKYVKVKERRGQNCY
jgi:hypothetical protein